MIRCEACEAPLTAHTSDHTEQAFMCMNQGCPRSGICLTCAVLYEWLGEVDPRDE